MHSVSTRKSGPRAVLDSNTVADDPKDNPVLACALEGHADFVVTDDRKHLLPLKHYHGIQIVSMPLFLRTLGV